MKTPPLFKLSALAVAALLSACGGGGGGGSPTPVKPAALVQLWTAQPHPYVAGSPEQIAFDEANRLRIRGGFGAFTYDANVTQTAKNHLNYEVLNTMYPVHDETAGLPGFTGTGPDQRYKYVVPPASDITTWLTLGEVGSLAGNTFPPMDGWSVATGHLQSILDYQKRWVGIASTVVNNPYGSGLLVNFDLAYSQNNRVTLPANWGWSIVGVYPFPGMTNVGIGYNTVPNITAMNILVQFPLSATSTSCSDINPIVSHFTLRKNGATSDVPTRQVVGGQYNGTEPTDAGWAIMFPTVVLEPNTQYNVDFAGSFCGAVSTKTWSFTTGTSEYSQAGT